MPRADGGCLLLRAAWVTSVCAARVCRGTRSVWVCMVRLCPAPGLGSGLCRLGVDEERRRLLAELRLLNFCSAARNDRFLAAAGFGFGLSTSLRGKD